MDTSRQYLRKIDENRYGVERHGAMHVDGLVFLDEELLGVLGTDESIRQVENVACLPGIAGPSMAMPDIHWGYGFPIGGVAAFHIEEGVVSPGGVGYDINCGVRLIRSTLTTRDLARKTEDIIEGLHHNIPSGVGSRRRDLKLSGSDLKRVLQKGSTWAVEHGYGTPADLRFTEDEGCLTGADPDQVSERAYERGRDQLGTLGSGNHFVELGVIEEVYDEKAAQAFGLFPGHVTIMIHTGSRGLGYQVCDDYIREMIKASARYGITLPDRQLCAAPLESPEGRRYLSAMASASNYAYANRQIITHWVRETFEAVFRAKREKLGLTLVYDVCHNTAKIETHKVGGKSLLVCVHRKGATRAFGPGHPPHTPRVPVHGPARPHPRGHGQGLLRSLRNHARHGGNLRQHLPRGRQGHEQVPGHKEVERPLHPARARGPGHPRQSPRQGDLRRGDARSLQGCLQSREGGPQRRHLETRSKDRPPGLHQGMSEYLLILPSFLYIFRKKG